MHLLTVAQAAWPVFIAGFASHERHAVCGMVRMRKISGRRNTGSQMPPVILAGMNACCCMAASVALFF